MNYKFIVTVIASIIFNTSYADEIEDFVLAYSSAQASNLPTKFKNQTLSLTSLDLIAVTTLKKMGYTEILQKYYEQPEFQKTLRLVIQNQINTPEVDSIFDDVSTKLFNDLYTIEEMQALYQLNSSESGKEFIDKMETVEKITQNFIELSYKKQFDKESYEKLEIDIKKVFENIETEEISETKEDIVNIIESAQQKTNPIILTEQPSSIVVKKVDIELLENNVSNIKDSPKDINISELTKSTEVSPLEIEQINKSFLDENTIKSVNTNDLNKNR